MDIHFNQNVATFITKWAVLQNAAEQWLKLMVVQLYLFSQPYDWLNKN